ncbi:hypothetical protein HDE_14367 [Halotydeus destructor]|nr:hypothetical protein HDE_14367 [Halotydeus destructor]
MKETQVRGKTHQLIATMKDGYANVIYVDRNFIVFDSFFKERVRSFSSAVFTDRTQTYKTSQSRNMYFTFKTVGASTCQLHDALSVSSTCSHFTFAFQGLTDYSNTIKVTRVAGTQLNSGKYLFMLHSDNGNSTEYHQLLLREDGMLSDSKISSAPLPTALTSFTEHGGKSEKMMAFHEEIMGYYEYDESKNNLLALNRNIDYQSGGPWLYCYFEMCFDGRIDSMTNSFYGEIYKMTKNHFSYAFNGRSELNWRCTDYPEEAMERLPFKTIYRDYIISYGDQCRRQYEDLNMDCFKRMACATLFPKFHHISNIVHPDAFFAIDESKLLYVISKDKYIVYEETYRLGFTYIEHGLMSDLWPGLPSEIDGATRSLGNSEMLFSRDNFIYSVALSDMKQNKSLPDIKLIQEVLVQGVCDDDFYKYSPGAALLNISTFEEFKAYRYQFHPFATTSLPETTSTPQTSQTAATVQSTATTSPTASKKRTPPTASLPTLWLWTLILGIIVALIVSIIIWKCKSKQSKKMNGSNEALFPTGVSTSVQTSVLLMESKTQTQTKASDKWKQDISLPKEM